MATLTDKAIKNAKKPVSAIFMVVLITGFYIGYKENDYLLFVRPVGFAILGFSSLPLYCLNWYPIPTAERTMMPR